KNLVINLYQTAAEEVANAYRDQMRHKGSEALEFAAQLRISLDGAPSAGTLRYFWQRANALPLGVLFPDLPADMRRPDQGSTEIVAIATAAEAYRSCTGNVTRKQEAGQSAGDKQEMKTDVSAKGKELLQPLISLASGVAVAAAASYQQVQL